jgi:endonuclease/exonuclease/phosphatase family metal-dependent hydrolase
MAPMRRAGLRVVTWNVWFNSWERELRQQALWAEIAANDPDIVCLQEVVRDHLAGPEIGGLRERGYWISEARTVGYDVIVATRLPVLASERVPLPSVMGRELLVVRLGTRPALTVATVHLESTAAKTATRVRQLTEIDAWLARETDVLLVGDMNFPDGERPEAAVLAGWTDAWPRCHPGDPGFTVDSEVNEMRAQIKPGDKRARIDRAFHRGEGWRVEAIERLGTRPCAFDPPLAPIFVSDHFGLRVDLARS